MNSNVKPNTHQADLTKLPRTLTLLTERSQWAVWRWTRQGNGWQKPPFIATQPGQHASTKDPKTWTDYTTALATVQAGKADGISYMLTEDDLLPLSISIIAELLIHTASIFGRRIFSILVGTVIQK